MIYDHEARDIKIGESFFFEGERFMRIKFVGCGGVVKMDKSFEPHKILAVSLETHDLIVIDRFAEVAFVE